VPGRLSRPALRDLVPRYEGFARARWLNLAAVAIGAVGIWSVHFISMLGFTIPGEPLGATAASFLIPLLLVISPATFLLTLTISVTPSEDEIRADREIRRRLKHLEQRNENDSLRR
jgi:NO-binding membrane sensor protein with MHYT domain